MKGLLGTSQLPRGSGLLILPSQAVHTFFMRYPIDVLFLRKERVLGAVGRLAPYRFSPVYWRAESVLELPAGTIQESRTEPGDRIEIQPAEGLPASAGEQ